MIRIGIDEYDIIKTNLNDTKRLIRMRVNQYLVNACENAMNSTILFFTEFSSVFSLHACVHTCVFVCVFSCFTCVHAPKGETGCVGCYLLLQRVTANHQP